MIVSYYSAITNTKSKEQQSIIAVLQNIKNGVYEDYVYPVRNAKSDEEKRKAKLKAPCISTSGTFSQRGNDYLLNHSNLIAIDFDHLSDLGDTFNNLINDNYTFALFRSISGDGLCCIVKIDGKRHLDAFNGLEKYYYQNYGIEADRACKDVSRPRYLSYDPDLFLNEDSDIFKQYPKKETKQQQKKFSSFQHGNHYQSKFELVLSRINQDITSNYEDWIKIGFAIASEYGEAGLDYFKQISQYHPDYDEYKTERKYRSLLSDRANGITISSFYYLCQLNGIDITDDNEKIQRDIAKKLKLSGKSESEVIKEIPGAIPEVIKEEFKKPVANNQLDLDAVELWLRGNYDIKLNEVTRFYELNGHQLEQKNINSIYIKAKKLFPKISKEIIESFIYSDETPSHNPIKDYFNSLEWDGQDYIAALSTCITSNTGDADFRLHGLEKWLIGMVESILNDKPNILCLVLAGKQNTGKSTFFTQLLPKQLKHYFATSQLDRGKDDEILLCQSLIIFDDEFSGKSKQDAKQMKRILSAPSFTLREPYGRHNVTLKRIATLCGTCNELDVLNDPTGNRRFIVYEINGKFDYELYNAIDKEMLFAQIVSLVKKGHNSDLNDDFIDKLQQLSDQFKEVSIEEEMLNKMFVENHNYPILTTSEIKDFIESNSNQRLSVKKLGTALRLKYTRFGSAGRYGYKVQQTV